VATAIEQPATASRCRINRDCAPRPRYAGNVEAPPNTATPSWTVMAAAATGSPSTKSRNRRTKPDRCSAAMNAATFPQPDTQPTAHEQTTPRQPQPHQDHQPPTPQADKQPTHAPQLPRTQQQPAENPLWTNPNRRQTPALPWGLRPFSNLPLSSPQWVAQEQSVDNSRNCPQVTQRGPAAHPAKRSHPQDRWPPPRYLPRPRIPSTETPRTDR